MLIAKHLKELPEPLTKILVVNELLAQLVQQRLHRADGVRALAVHLFKSL